MNNMSFGEFKVEVQTTNNRGATPEEIAHRCVGSIVSFSQDAHPSLRDQAIAYRDSIEKLLVIHMKQAIQSDRTTVYNAIKEAGHPTLAEYIRKM
tara:strand:- start:547 stop:831 length:285 start_codon:yes stop_codon:yes gene_type:complete